LFTRDRLASSSFLWAFYATPLQMSCSELLCVRAAGGSPLHIACNGFCGLVPDKPYRAVLARKADYNGMQRRLIALSYVK